MPDNLPLPRWVAGGLAIPVGFDFGVHLEPLHPITQGVPADLELVGGAGQVVAVLRQGLLDNLPLVMREDGIEGAARRWGDGGREGREMPFQLEIRQAVGLDFSGGFENEGALDGVAQF
jgi:hypothetical protein